MSASRYPTPAEPSKAMAMASMIIGILSVLTLSCFGIGALTGLILGIVALLRTKRQPRLYGGRGMAIVGITASSIAVFLIPVLGIVAAIAIPSLLRARVSANEAATIGDIRTVISAQAAYQSANQGAYEGQLRCLSRPSEGCIPNYTTSGPSFLDATLTDAGVKSGYARRLDAGPAPSPFDPELMSPTSVSAFAYVAFPVEPGKSGIRGFCGDASGVICSTPDGSEPRTRDGACDLSTCEPIG
jgi:type IV pilus assembly protein PilA